MDVLNPKVVRVGTGRQGKLSITHYTNYLDETGRPYAVDPAHYPPEALAGELPEEWHPDFWDWEPLGDINGTWVEKEKELLQVIWNETKQERTVASNGLVPVTLRGTVYQFQADETSLLTLHRKLSLTSFNPDYVLSWVLPNNDVIELPYEDLVKVVTALEHARDDVFFWSQKARQEIFDPKTRTPRELGAFKHSAKTGGADDRGR